MRGSRPREREREKFMSRQPPIGEKDDDDSKTLGSQKGSPAAAKEGGDGRGREGEEGGQRRWVRARSTLERTAPKARSRSREVVDMNEAPRIFWRLSSKSPSRPSMS